MDGEKEAETRGNKKKKCRIYTAVEELGRVGWWELDGGKTSVMKETMRQQIKRRKKNEKRRRRSELRTSKKGNVFFLIIFSRILNK